MGIRDIYANGGTPVSNAIDRFYQAKNSAMTKRLMPEAMSGKPEALNQLMAVNPDAGFAVQNRLMMQQQQAQQAKQQEVENQLKNKQLQQADLELQIKQEEFNVAKNAPPKPIALSEGQTLVDPKTFKTLATNPKEVDPTEAITQSTNLRKEFSSQSTLFKVQDDAYGRIVASAQKPSAAGDLALITSYMKVLDPTSSVREGEFATAQNSGSVPQKIIALQNQIMNGQRLTPEQRADFVSKSKDLYKDAADKQLKTQDRYKKLSTVYKINPDDVVENMVNYREQELGAINAAAKPKAGGDVKFLGFEE